MTTTTKIIIRLSWIAALVLFLLFLTGRDQIEPAEVEADVTQFISTRVQYDDGDIIESEDFGFNGEGIREERESRRACRAPIIDIRDQPGVSLMGGNYTGLADRILGFRGYDSHFKFENQIWLAQGRSDMLWWPYWGAK